MKLLTAATRASLQAAALIFVLGGGLFYGGVRTLIYEEIDEELHGDRLIVQKWVRQHGRLPGDDSRALVNHLTFAPGRPSDPAETWRDSTLFEPSSGEQQPYRLVTFPVTARGQTTRITLGKPLVESEALFFTILIASALLGTVLLLTFTGINRRQSRRLLQPFYQALTQLEAYQLRRDQPLRLNERGQVDEFNQLNHSINLLIERALTDYRSVKEFTANASHELQTPLAVIQSKLEVLLQNEALPDAVSQTVTAIQQTVFKLSRLNQTLLLLAKIENGQFDSGRELIALSPLITDKLDSLREWIDHRAITVTTDLYPATVSIHPVLADVLVANLIGNAVKHNTATGRIDISLIPHQLRIKNTGQPLRVDPETLFGRFQKAGNAPQSVGLGLSIVREIGEQNGLIITYTYEARWHQLTVNWL